MIDPSSTLIVLLAILGFSLLIPEIFRKFRLPFVTLIILTGAILGPNGVNYIQQNDIISFFGFLGMTFLMLMAGIEISLPKIKKNKHKIFLMATLNGLIPFIVGFFIVSFFGYSLIDSLIIGIIFISSSVIIIISSLESAKIIKKEIFQLILMSTLILDISSLLILTLVIQTVTSTIALPLFIYIPILLATIASLFLIIPKVTRYAIRKRFLRDVGYERLLRFIIVIFIAIIVVFSLLGIHPILAAFLSGLILSGIVDKEKSTIIYEKLHILSYGLFIPIFFFIVGMDMDLSLFRSFDMTNVLMVSIILGLIFSKILSGFISGRLAKLSRKNSLIFGSVSMVQLTTTLAVVYTASSLGLLDSILITSIILLSIITTFVGPTLTVYIANRNSKKDSKK